MVCKKMNKKFALLCFFAAMLYFPILTAAVESDHSKKMLDSVAAIVNDDVITQKELDNKFDLIKQQLANSQTALPEDAELRLQVLNHLIDQKIELQTAARAGIEVDDETVNKSIHDLAARNNLSFDEFKDYLSKNHFKYSEFRNEIHDQIIVERLMQREIGSHITISTQEIDKYLNSIAFEQKNIAEYHLQDILISLPEVPSTDQISKADAKIADILAQIKQGKTFEQMAIANSDGGEALQGGDLGWRRIEEIPIVFAERVQIMEKGEVFGPIRAPNGYHLLKLVAIRGSSTEHFSTETKVKHILLRKDPVTSDEQLKKNIENIRAQIGKDLNFADAAKKYSQDPVSAAKGGDLGWITDDMLVPPFTKAMNELKIGVISEPVRTEYGWHLIEVEARRQKEDTKDFQRNQIRKSVFERKYQEQAQSWIKRMRDASYVEILIPTDTLSS